jgi:eukaryotic-like serine/threonine-protein kinase
MGQAGQTGDRRDDEGGRFWAFISYSHRDEKIVRRLHRALETYRVPKPLVGMRRGGFVVPPRLAPVFRDRDELASAPDLSQEIKSALGQSRALVVVCSPEAARSPRVNDEILWFRNIGRSQRVISVIVSGEPGVGEPGRECFPRALLMGPDGTTAAITPIAADARPGKDETRGSLQKVVAGILGISLDELRQRERQRRKQAAIRIVVSALAMLFVLVTVYVGLSDAKVPLPGAATVRGRRPFAPGWTREP